MAVRTACVLFSIIWCIGPGGGADSPNEGFTPLCSDKSHARVIWDCAWASEGDIFATAARDKTVRVVALQELSCSKCFNISVDLGQNMATS